MSTVSRALKRDGPELSLAPILFIGTSDESSRDILSELFEFTHPLDSAGSHVFVSPFGDAMAGEGDMEGDRQAVALVTTLVSSEEDAPTGAFARAAQDAAMAFTQGNDVVWSVAHADVLRGDLGGTSLFQAILEQFLAFEENGLVDVGEAPKTLHLIVADVGKEEAEELSLEKEMERLLTQIWRRLIVPVGSALKEEENEEEAAGLSAPAWTRLLNLNVIFAPSKVYAGSERARALASLKGALDEKLVSSDPFLPASSLRQSIAALLPVSQSFLSASTGPSLSRSIPKHDTLVSSFYLDKLVVRYTALFRQDARHLLEELNTGYDEDFGRTFSELIEKYLSDFHQEVYGQDAGPIHASLAGLNAGQVAVVVRTRKENLHRALLGLTEEGYVRQLQFLKQMAQEEFRKGISALKYQWELIPGFAKAIKAAKALFVDRAGKLACARSGSTWKAIADKELRSLSKVLETQADEVIERTRASGGFVPSKLRRPIGVQVNWLGANFFHFLRDSSVDPVSIRTDSGVALWERLGETWASRDGKDQRVSARYRAVYGEDIDGAVMDYLLTSPKGVGLNDRDPRIRFGWNRKVAYDLVRNHDDMTFQVPHAKAIASY